LIPDDIAIPCSLVLLRAGSVVLRSGTLWLSVCLQSRAANIPLLIQTLHQDRALDSVSFSENDMCRLLNRFRQNIISSENTLSRNVYRLSNFFWVWFSFDVNCRRMHSIILAYYRLLVIEKHFNRRFDWIQLFVLLLLCIYHRYY
jgi:hypothetical protein